MKMLAKGNKRLVMERIARAARRILLVPLAATILHGCSQNECHSHNETTILLNRPTDGTVAGIDELEKEPPAGVLITEPLIKFVNETHAISSGGMPQEVYVTQVPQYCFDNLDATAYAIPDYNSVYIRGPITLQSLGFGSLNHEIGHLQPAGVPGEGISQLNEIEQRLTGFAILAMQQTGKPQPIFFDPIGNDKERIYNLIDRSYFYKQFQTKDPVEEAYDSFMWVNGNDYTTATVFLLLRLPKIDGNFSRLREETEHLMKSDGFEQEKEAVIKAAIAEYFSYNFDIETIGTYSYMAEVDLTLMMAYFKELYRKFGPDIASLFFYNDSHDEWYYVSSKHIKSGHTLGFEEMDCKQTIIEFSTELTTNCTDEEVCMELSASFKTAIQNKTLCCVQVDPNSLKEGEPTFRKFIVHGSGYRYEGSVTLQGGHISYNYVTVDGFQEQYVDVLDTSKIAEIGINEPCQ